MLTFELSLALRLPRAFSHPFFRQIELVSFFIHMLYEERGSLVLK